MNTEVDGLRQSLDAALGQIAALQAKLEAAHADVRALALSALDYLDHAHRDSDNLRNDLARPSVRKIVEGT